MRDLQIIGTILPEGFGIYLEEGTLPSDFIGALNNADEDICIHINSCGGCVESQQAMSIALTDWARKHPDAKINIEIGALCASAATNFLVALPDYVKVSVHEQSMIMSHSVAGGVFGTPDELRDNADYMDKINSAAIRGWLRSSDLPEETIRGWFATGREGWLSGQEAIDCHLADYMIDGPVHSLQKIDTSVYTDNKLVAFFKGQQTVLDKCIAKKGECKMPNPEENPAPMEEPKKEEPMKEQPCAEEPVKEPCAEEPQQEPGKEPETPPCPEEKEECPNKEDDDLRKEIEMLKQQIEELKNTVQNLTSKNAKLSAGMNTGTKPAEPSKTFMQYVREIPKGLSEREYSKQFQALIKNHAAEYKAYMDSHQNRNY